MRQRCLNANCREFKYYGGRGITICQRWAGPDGFRNFLADLGPKPFAGASLHRVDNDGNYAPRNVVWADRRTQARCTRGNRVLAHAGRRQTLIEWAEELGAKAGTLGARLARKWSVAATLTKPVEPRKPFAQWAPRVRPR